ncbi:unnamed protein product [Peniophora sp. CBMAI 1063]|nr:unnamed protein product [Peniophora sp. CBMAI 1063]
MNPTYPLQPVANFISSFLAFLVIISQPRQPCNKGIIYLAVWVSILSFITGIQMVIWRDSADTTIAPVFCDIVSRILVGTLIAMPACTLITCRCLHDMVRYSVINTVKFRKRRRDLLLDLVLFLGLPVISNIFYYVVQSARFSVLEESGCGVAIVVSGLTLMLISGPPLIVFCFSFVYFSITITLLVKHRRSMNRLFGRQMAISQSLYLRLLAFGFILILVSAAAFANVAPLPTEFYPGWSVVHSDWTPLSVSTAEWQAGGSLTIFGVVWNGWIFVWLSTATFGLFGLTHDARATYMRVLRAVAGWPEKLHLCRSHADDDSILPRHRLKCALKLSKLRGASLLDCTLPVPPPAAVILPERAGIEVEVTVEYQGDEDAKTLTGSGTGEKATRKV